MRFLPRLFETPTARRSGWQVVVWWEKRRPAYNVILVTSGMLWFVGFALVVKGWFDFLAPPFFWPLQLALFLMVANICYSGGWIVELLSRSGMRDPPKRFGPVALKAGLIFSILVTGTPTIAGVIGLVLGRPVASPYALFTETEPAFEAVAGTYVLDSTCINILTRAGIESEELPTITLHADSSLTFSSLPAWRDTTGRYSKYPSPDHGPWSGYVCDLYRGSGTWKLRFWEGQRGWRVMAKIKHSWLESGKDDKDYSGPTCDIHLRNETPPYELYMILGDPDSWQAFIYRQVMDMSINSD